MFFTNLPGSNQSTILYTQDCPDSSIAVHGFPITGMAESFPNMRDSCIYKGSCAGISEEICKVRGTAASREEGRKIVY